MALTLCVFTESKAQRLGTASDCRRGGRHCCDSVLLSQKRDGNYMVCKYLVKHDRNNDFAVRYRINLSTMSPTSDGNGSELAALNAFMDSLAKTGFRRSRSHKTAVQCLRSSRKAGVRVI